MNTNHSLICQGFVCHVAHEVSQSDSRLGLCATLQYCVGFGGGPVCPFGSAKMGASHCVKIVIIPAAEFQRTHVALGRKVESFDEISKKES